MTADEDQKPRGGGRHAGIQKNPEGATRCDECATPAVWTVDVGEGPALRCDRHKVEDEAECDALGLARTPWRPVPEGPRCSWRNCWAPATHQWSGGWQRAITLYHCAAHAEESQRKTRELLGDHVTPWQPIPADSRHAGAVVGLVILVLAALLCPGCGSREGGDVPLWVGAAVGGVVVSLVGAWVGDAVRRAVRE